MNKRILRYQSMGEFCDYIANTPRLDKNNNFSEHPDDMYSNWYQSKDLPSAIELGRTGWDSESAQVKAMSSPMLAKITSLVEKPHIVYDVEGAQLDVARYLDGEPECWQKWDNQLTEGFGVRHVRIVFNCMISCDISTEVIRAKGASIAALVEALEYGGSRVQLDVAIGYGAFEAYVTVKLADQPLDLPRLVFALAHPSMARRLFFALLERQPEHKKLIGLGYGGDKVNYDWRAGASEHGDVYITESRIDRYQWSTPETCRKWILAELEKQGISLRKGEQQ